MCGYKKILEESYNKIKNIDSITFKSKLYTIEYLLEGEGPVVLISHGVSGGVDQGMRLANNFFKKKYKFLFISRFGYLKSSIPENPSAELQADAYKELLDHLKIEKTFLYANSAGSTSVLNFAIKYPQYCKGIILQSANAPLDFDPGSPPKFIFKSNFLYWFFLKLLGKMMMSMFVPKALLEELPKDEKKMLMDEVFFSVLPITERTKGTIFDTSISNPSINNNLSYEKITAPTLIVNARDDPATAISGARTLAKEIKNSRLIELETGGHLLHGQVDKVKMKIESFIEDIKSN